MKYIIPSIGRCSSSLIFLSLSSALANKGEFASSYASLKNPTASVIKTHAHLEGELPYEYRAVFMYGAITPIIKSLYHICQNKGSVRVRGAKKDFMKMHLKNLGVKKLHRFIFEVLLILDQATAFFFLIRGDKFRFRKNMASWRNSKNTLFIKYEALICNKKKSLDKISDFLGLRLPEFELIERSSRNVVLPKPLEKEIEKVYGEISE